MRKVIGQVKGTLTGEAELYTQAKRSKELYPHLSLAGRCPAPSWIAVSARVMVIWEDKCNPTYYTPCLLLASIAEHDIVWYGVSPSSVQVSCHGCVPSQLLSHLQPTSLEGQSGEKRNEGGGKP